MVQLLHICIMVHVARSKMNRRCKDEQRWAKGSQAPVTGKTVRQTGDAEMDEWRKNGLKERGRPSDRGNKLRLTSNGKLGIGSSAERGRGDEWAKGSQSSQPPLPLHYTNTYMSSYAAIMWKAVLNAVLSLFRSLTQSCPWWLSSLWYTYVYCSWHDNPKIWGY